MHKLPHFINFTLTSICNKVIIIKITVCICLNNLKILLGDPSVSFIDLAILAQCFSIASKLRTLTVVDYLDYSVIFILFILVSAISSFLPTFTFIKALYLVFIMTLSIFLFFSFLFLPRCPVFITKQFIFFDFSLCIFFFLCYSLPNRLNLTLQMDFRRAIKRIKQAK